MILVQLLLAGAIVILLIWNIGLLKKTRNENNDKSILEIKAKLNFIVATGSLAVLVITYLGWDAKENIKMQNEIIVNEMIENYKEKLDSIFDENDLLKSQLFIVSGLEYEENNQKFVFNELKTVNGDRLPTFEHSPKIIVETSTGENLRIVETTSKYFILDKPIKKHWSLSTGENEQYPDILEFDVWIVNY